MPAAVILMRIGISSLREQLAQRRLAAGLDRRAQRFGELVRLQRPGDLDVHALLAARMTDTPAKRVALP